jgi:hypothetical protein
MNTAASHAQKIAGPPIDQPDVGASEILAKRDHILVQSLFRNRSQNQEKRLH